MSRVRHQPDGTAALATLAAKHPIGEARPPVLVATLGDPAADVFWAASPRDIDLGGFCARRERVVRGTLVLVPTSERVAVDVAARFAPGEHVEVRALADTIEVRDGIFERGPPETARGHRADEPVPTSNSPR